MITTTSYKVTATLSGLPQTISLPFAFQYASDLLVLDGGSGGFLNDPATVLTLASDYTVTGGGYNTLYQLQTGSVIVNSGGSGNVQSGDVITVMRNCPVVQTTSSTMGVVSAQSWEAALDKLTIIDQQQQEQLNRCLTIEPVETLSTTLLNSQRKGMVLGFSSTGAISFLTSAGSAGVFLTATGTPVLNQLGGWVNGTSLQGITLGTGLSMAGTTLNSTGGLSGGTATQVVYFTGAATYGSNSGFVSDTSGNVTTHGLTVSTFTTAGILVNAVTGVVGSISITGGGAISTLGPLLGSSWSPSTSLFLRADGTWNTAAGSGNVSTSGGITNNYLAVWASGTTIKALNTIDAMVIGGSAPAAATFTTLTTTGIASFGTANVATVGLTLGTSTTGNNSAILNLSGTLTASGNSNALIGANSAPLFATTNSGYTSLVSYNLLVGTPTKSGTSGLGTSYQLYISTGVAATSHYGIYQAGTDTNYFAGAFTMSPGALQATNQNLCPATVTVTGASAGTVNWALGNSFYYALTGSTTISFSNAVDGQTIVVKILNTVSNYTVTWPSIKWPGNTAPTMTTGAKYDLYNIQYDATIGAYIGTYSQNYS